jgi:hypothetical protein
LTEKAHGILCQPSDTSWRRVGPGHRGLNIGTAAVATVIAPVPYQWSTCHWCVEIYPLMFGGVVVVGATLVSSLVPIDQAAL